MALPASAHGQASSLLFHFLLRGESSARAPAEESQNGSTAGAPGPGIYRHVCICIRVYTCRCGVPVLMRDEKEERSKQGRNTAHPRQSLFLRKKRKLPASGGT